MIRINWPLVIIYALCAGLTYGVCCFLLTMPGPLRVFFGSFLVWGWFNVVYDTFQARRYGLEGTISWWMFTEGKHNRLFVFVVGLVLGLMIGGLATHFW